MDETFVPPTPDWLVNSGINALALQPDGKLVAGLPAFDGICVARFNPDGSLDSSFALGVCSDWASFTGLACMIRLANGQILAGGGFNSFNGVAVGQIVRLHGDEAIAALAPFSLGLRWSAGQLVLSLFGEAGRTYTLEASTNLPQFLPWTNIISTGTNWLPIPLGPQGFFRARIGN